MTKIVVTGGSGKAGRHVIQYLLNKGYRVLNLDLVPFPDEKLDVYTLKTDLTDSGQVYGALTSHFNMAGYEDGAPPGPPDAVVHLAAYARNLLVPDVETFKANVSSTYNVIEAASKLGVKKIIIASSETTYGVCFSEGDTDFHEFPLTEDFDDPMDSYALSKVCGEKTAKAFARRFKSDIYALRIGNVIEPHEYELLFPAFINNPASRKRNAWSYIDARDLGQICHLAIEKSGLGFQIFNATNDTITVANITTKDFLQKECPNVPIRREMESLEAPMTNKKIRDMLGFREEHNWRKYVKFDPK